MVVARTTGAPILGALRPFRFTEYPGAERLFSRTAVLIQVSGRRRDKRTVFGRDPPIVERCADRMAAALVPIQRIMPALNVANPFIPSRKKMSMREFLAIALLVTGSLVIGANACADDRGPAGAAQSSNQTAKNGRPNILWLSAEDIGPHLGCYSDAVAATPNLDRLARRGMRFRTAWSNYPVCAPARTTVITGMYAASNGAGHMRCLRPLEPQFGMFPARLRAAGYYCTNRVKEDYNHPKPDGVWDESSRQAHYRNRDRDGHSDSPFFAVFNFTGTHESQIRKRPHRAVTDPARVELPPYWPDRPEVRQDWAQYYDNIRRLDQWVGDKLKELDELGLADQTIVVFWGDHGSGMPRHKRFAGDSGMRVPLLVYFPKKYEHLAPAGYAPGMESGQLVSFVDLAPTMLSLAGIEPPPHMQGHPFAGDYRDGPRSYLYGFRMRMDERPDFSRSIRDERYVYIRNYRPYLPHGQWLDYQMQTPTTRVWFEMFGRQKLSDVQRAFWLPRQPEELYDLSSDPHETVNLAARPGMREVLNRFRGELKRHTLQIGDLGFMPEPLLQRTLLHIPASRLSREEQRYPLEQIFDLAELAGRRSAALPPELRDAASADNATLRHWAAMGLLVRGEAVCRQERAMLEQLMKDPEPSVSIVAAEALAMYGDEPSGSVAVEHLLELADLDRGDYLASVWALNALDHLATRYPLAERVRPLSKKPANFPRGNNYAERLVAKILSNFESN